MIDFIPAAEFFKTIQPDERVSFLVRHGERGHILPNDPNHGALVGLTDRGREQATHLGQAIANGMNFDSAKTSSSIIDTSISFFSSPVGRCMQTAEYIGRGLGIASPEVVPCQPLAEFFVEHYEAYMETHRTGFYQGICRWLDGSAADPSYIDPAYFPLAKRSEELLQLMLSKGSSRINIFATHDAWVVPCLTHFCGLKFTPQRWMNFLTGMAVVLPTNAAASPENVKRIVPVTALDTGWMLF